MLERRWQPAGRLPAEALHVAGNTRPRFQRAHLSSSLTLELCAENRLLGTPMSRGGMGR